jgi:DNA-binding CsgD family transcriptional regulator
VRHLPVFLNLACLALGIVCLARLSMDHAQKRNLRTLSRLAFFASYSYLMLLGFFFSYYLINVGSDSRAEYTFASLIFLGMAAIEIVFPWMMDPLPPENGKRPWPAWGIAAAAMTLLQAGLIWILPRNISAFSLVFAFGPFIAVLLATLLRAAKSGPRRLISLKEALSFLLYIPIAAWAAFEIIFISSKSSSGGYAVISLALAYALTSAQFLRAVSPSRSAGGNAVLAELPPALALRARLSAREAEMARYILEGKENKEIAAALSLSENTVRNHIYSLYQKLGIQRRMDLVRLIRQEKTDDST